MPSSHRVRVRWWGWLPHMFGLVLGFGVEVAVASVRVRVRSVIIIVLLVC